MTNPGLCFDGCRDGAALLGIVLSAAWFAMVSWRKWPDPLIDFGPRLLVLVWANLVVFAAIALLAGTGAVASRSSGRWFSAPRPIRSVTDAIAS